MQVHRPWATLMLLLTIALLQTVTEAQVLRDLSNESNAKVKPETNDQTRAGDATKVSNQVPPASTSPNVPRRSPTRVRTPTNSTRKATRRSKRRPKAAANEKNGPATANIKPGTVTTFKEAPKTARETEGKVDESTPSSTKSTPTETSATPVTPPSTPPSAFPAVAPPQVDATAAQPPPSPPSTPPAPSNTITEKPLAAASTLAKSATTSDKKKAPNGILISFMLGGAAALVLAVGCFVYTRSKKQQMEQAKHDDMDPDLLSAHPANDPPAAQASTIAATYHQDMSPVHYNENDFQSTLHLSFHRSQSHDPNLDELTPKSQIALAHSQMSLPVMEQSRASNGLASFASQSDFYESSIYSLNDSSVSSASNQVSGVRPGDRHSSFMNVTCL
ncbi:hypothetical protein PsorP6_015585 [Peronosclerospora sorghi]|uniref:Uncharacterized protein n=1 Tax=Peronosclerospora sorghi TaxID=230839 RepID=A0ACC0WPU1_9STRA|nr:hypothetical protein PsorP6_015585 [Peronosclerospora sorghi]